MISLSLSVYIYVCMYVCTYVMYVYVCIYIEREMFAYAYITLYYAVPSAARGTGRGGRKPPPLMRGAPCLLALALVLLLISVL